MSTWGTWAAAAAAGINDLVQGWGMSAGDVHPLGARWHMCTVLIRLPCLHCHAASGNSRRLALPYSSFTQHVACKQQQGEPGPCSTHLIWLRACSSLRQSA